MRAPTTLVAALCVGGCAEVHPQWLGPGTDAGSASDSGSSSGASTTTATASTTASSGGTSPTAGTSDGSSGGGSSGGGSSGGGSSGGGSATSGGSTSGGTGNGACAAAVAWEFMNCPDGWTVEKAVPEAQGTPTWECGEASSGPGAAGHPGQWATGLAGTYTGRESSALISPSIDLSGCAGSGVRMEMEHWWDFEGGGGNNDGSIIEVSPDGGTSWTYVSPDVGGYFMDVVVDASYPPVAGQFGFSSSNGGNPMTWTHTEVDLEPFTGNADVRIRLVFGSDPLVVRDGWYVDRVAITTP